MKKTCRGLPRYFFLMVLLPTCLLSAGFAGNFLPQSEAGTVLAGGGGTKYRIVLSEDAGEAENHAAEELSLYLGRASGAEFTIVKEGAPGDEGNRIFIGAVSASLEEFGGDFLEALGEEGFAIRTSGDNIFIAGGGPRGVMYGAYEFLERYIGCRWFNIYGEEYVPETGILRVDDIDLQGSPAFGVRDIHHVPPTPVGDRDTYRSFFARNKMTGPSSVRWAGFPGGSPLEWAGPYRVHTLFSFIDPDEYFEGNPEYFSLRDGKRVKNMQLCFSSEGLRKELTGKVLAVFEKAAGRGMVDVSAMDWRGEFCECPGCRNMAEKHETPGAPLLDYLVELAGEVKSLYPEAYLSTLAYRTAQTEIPPSGMRIPDNVIIRFAPIESNVAAPLTHPSNSDSLENLKSWLDISENVWIWYYPNPYGEAGALPIGNLNRLADDMRLFNEIGVKGIFSESGPMQQFLLMADILGWIRTKLLWDPHRDLEELVADFTDRFYGSAAPYVREHVNLMERATKEADANFRWRPAVHDYEFLTGELIRESLDLLARAERAVSDDSELLRRVRRLKLSPYRAAIICRDRLEEAGYQPDLEEKSRKYGEIYLDLLDRYVTWSWTLERYRRSNKKYWGDVEAPVETDREAKPLPGRFAGFSEEEVIRIFPDSMSRRFSETTIVKDEHAATGYAATRQTTDEGRFDPIPFRMGYYWRHGDKRVNAEVGGAEITSPGYEVYRIGRTNIDFPESIVWFTGSWRFQFPLEHLFDFSDPGREWDIYASLRFEGPSYPHGGVVDEDRVYVDQIILVSPRNSRQAKVYANPPGLEKGPLSISNGHIRVSLGSGLSMLNIHAFDRALGAMGEWVLVGRGAIGLGIRAYYEVLGNETPEEVETRIEGDRAVLTFRLVDRTEDARRGTGGGGEFYQSYRITLEKGGYGALVELIDEAEGGENTASWRYNLSPGFPGYLVGRGVRPGVDHVDCAEEYEEDFRTISLSRHDGRYLGAYNDSNGYLYLISHSAGSPLASVSKQGIRVLYTRTTPYIFYVRNVGAGRNPAEELLDEVLDEVVDFSAVAR